MGARSQARKALWMTALPVYALFSPALSFALAHLARVDLLGGWKRIPSPSMWLAAALFCLLLILACMLSLKLFPSRAAVFLDMIRPLLLLPRTDLMLLALLASPSEELLFRGAVQPLLGLLPTSFLFGALHGFFRPPLDLWSVFALASGLIFGHLYERSGSLLLVSFAHTLCNIVLLIYYRRLVIGHKGAQAHPPGP